MLLLVGVYTGNLQRVIHSGTFGYTTTSNAAFSLAAAAGNAAQSRPRAAANNAALSRPRPRWQCPSRSP